MFILKTPTPSSAPRLVQSTSSRLLCSSTHLSDDPRLVGSSVSREAGWSMRYLLVSCLR